MTRIEYSTLVNPGVTTPVSHGAAAFNEYYTIVQSSKISFG